MDTIIEAIETKIYPDGNEVLIVRFKYWDKLQFCYLTKKSQDYWKAKGVDKIEVGMKINVLKIPDEFKTQYIIKKFG